MEVDELMASMIAAAILAVELAKALKPPEGK
jgi:hypothetical protein